MRRLICDSRFAFLMTSFLACDWASCELAIPSFLVRGGLETDWLSLLADGDTFGQNDSIGEEDSLGSLCGGDEANG